MKSKFYLIPLLTQIIGCGTISFSRDPASSETKIIETCGMTGSIDQRIADCEAVLGREKSHQGLWTLVARTPKGKQVWQVHYVEATREGNQSRTVLWSEVSAQSIPQAEKDREVDSQGKFCQAKSDASKNATPDATTDAITAGITEVKWRIPTAPEVSSAASFGITGVFAEFEAQGNYFWLLGWGGKRDDDSRAPAGQDGESAALGGYYFCGYSYSRVGAAHCTAYSDSRYKVRCVADRTK